MISDGASTGLRPGGWEAITTLLAAEGSAVQPHVAALLAPRAAQRDLADAVHAICAVHGNAGEWFHEAAALQAGAGHRDWLNAVTAGFAGERNYIAAIVSAAGPLPSTPGQAQTEQALAAARHAFHMLTISDRQGCVLGAAAALLLDWDTFRAVLDRAASRFGVAPAPSRLTDAPDVRSFVGDDATAPAQQRAMMFGAQQVLAQHRAFWSLLDTRAEARVAAG